MTKTQRSTKNKPQAGTKAAKITVQKNDVPPSIDPEQRYGMIAGMAYSLAEKRGFQGEAALDDWLQAEADVDSKLSVDTPGSQ